METRRFQIRDGQPVSAPGWVYVWVRARRVIYVGATWIDPAARAGLHLHLPTDDVRSLALREAVAAQTGRLDSAEFGQRSSAATPASDDPDGSTIEVLCFPLPEGAARAAHKAALIDVCRDRGWLADDFIDPGPLASPDADPAWLAEALAALSATLAG